MSTSRFKRYAGFATIALAASLGTLLALRARAAGIPDAAALTYTGYLENPDGTPVIGTKGIGISVYDAESDGNEVCAVKPADVEPVAGRFQLTLPEKCTAAVKANPDLWIEVQVEGSLLGRTRLGAVPYAVEAQNAQRAAAADEATHAVDADAASSAAGALDERIAALEAWADVKSARIGTSGSEEATWISSVTKNGVGSYQIAFTAGAFATAPACVVTAAVGNSKSPAFECFNTATTGIECRANIHDPSPAALGIPLDSPFSILCVAPN